MNKNTSQFNINYVWWSLGIAIFAGFAIGAHVASVIGFGFPLGKAFYSYIQLHGYLQFIGWVGLLIIGISLFFLPRLAGRPLKNPFIQNTILKYLVAGLLLRFFSHSVLAYLVGSKFYNAVAGLSLSGALLVLYGIFLYVKTLFTTFPKSGKIPKGIRDIHVFLKTALFGWLLYPALKCILITDMFLRNSDTLNASWNEFATQSFLFLTLLPVTLAFSVRMFPLYLKLPVVNWPVVRLAKFYLVAVCLQLIPLLPPIASLNSKLPPYISQAGIVLKGGIILYFVWKLGFFQQRKLPKDEPVLQEAQQLFGKFNWLIYAAYAWLVLGALCEVLVAAGFLTGITIPVSSDAIRHIYLMGFVTSLIFGVSVRMIPGFIKKKSITKPGWVATTFWLVGFTAICRVAPLMLPPDLLNSVPYFGQVAYGLFGLSGILGMAALWILWMNLRKTYLK